MKQDQLDIMITLVAHKQAGATNSNNHLYRVFIDDKEYASNSIAEAKFVDSFIVNLSVSLDPGEHVLKVYYKNDERKGVLQIQNIFVSGDYGGINVDSLVKREGLVTYGDRQEFNKAAVWWHGTYQFTFQSPFFYWALSKFPM